MYEPIPGTECPLCGETWFVIDNVTVFHNKRCPVYNREEAHRIAMDRANDYGLFEVRDEIPT